MPLSRARAEDESASRPFYALPRTDLHLFGRLGPTHPSCVSQFWPMCQTPDVAGPLPSVPNALSCVFVWSSSGDINMQTKWFFRYSGGAPDATACTALAAAIYTAMAAQDDQWGSDVDLTNVIVTDLSSVSGGQGEESASTPGGKTPGALSMSTCLLINYKINRRYRGGKPRSYLPWLVETDLTNRRAWNGAAVATAEGRLSTIFAAIIGASSGSTTITEHINISYFDGFTVVTNPTTGRARNVSSRRGTPVVDAITGFTGSTRPASQRRRN
jgi:hypothetical protein